MKTNTNAKMTVEFEVAGQIYSTLTEAQFAAAGTDYRIWQIVNGTAELVGCL